MNKVVSYAQNREDILLAEFLKDVKKGFYVDVGANHPEHYSVTKFFYDKGWRGINIEPNKRLYNLLKLSRPRDVNINVGISNEITKLKFREYPAGDGLSTFSKEQQEYYLKNPTEVTQTYSDYVVNVDTLKDIFERNSVPIINFMKIDVEGYEYAVIESNDWEKYRPQLLCIEANHVQKNWQPLLQKHRYKKVFFDGLNEYYVANESSKIADNFSYPQAIFPSNIISPELSEELKVTNWHLRQAELKLIRQELIAESLQADIHQLHLQIQSSKRIRSIIKQLAKALDSVILMYIEKLNKPAVKASRSIDVVSVNPKVIIQQLQLYDFQLYYGAKTKRPLIYRLILKAYLSSSQLMRRVTLRAYKLLLGRKAPDNA